MLIITIALLFASISSNGSFDPKAVSPTQAIQSLNPNMATINTESVLSITFSETVDIEPDLLFIINKTRTFNQKCNDISAIDNSKHIIYCYLIFPEKGLYQLEYDTALQIDMYVLVDDVLISTILPVATVNSKGAEQTIILTFNQKPVPKDNIYYINDSKKATCFDSPEQPLRLACQVHFPDPGDYNIFIKGNEHETYIKVFENNFSVLSIMPDKIESSSLPQGITMELTPNTPSGNELNGFFFFGSNEASCKEIVKENTENKYIECNCLFDSVGTKRLFFGAVDSTFVIQVGDGYNNITDEAISGTFLSGYYYFLFLLALLLYN